MANHYQRVLLKLSGESLFDFKGQAEPKVALATILEQIEQIHKDGIQVAVVLGGGNICRGRTIMRSGAHRLTTDNVGMLATVINALVFKDVLDKRDIPSRIYSAFPVANMVNVFEPQRVLDDLASGHLVIFCGGTGNPLVSTDTASSLRAIQIEADAILKITNVDGVYDSDPNKDRSAAIYNTISHSEIIDKGLEIMDQEAFRQCKMFGMPIHIAHYKTKDVLRRIIQGDAVGTKIYPDGGDKC